MTLSNERLNALKHTKEFLRALIDPKQTPRVPRSIRLWASLCLKHFPESYYLESFKDLGKMVRDGLKQGKAG